MAAAALAVGGMTTWTWADDTKVSAEIGTDQSQLDRAESAADQTGETVGEKTDKVLSGEGLKGTAAAPDAEGIRDVLAQVAEASVAENGLDDLTERFVDADRNRIGEAIEQEDEAYNALVTRFQEAWKAKYNEDFDISNEEEVFKPEMVSIRQGEIGDSARLAGERSIDVDVNADANRTDTTADATADVNVDNKTGIDAPDLDDRQSAEDRNLNDPGRNTAQVMISESHGMPAVTVPLIHELPDQWRIDIPDSIDAAGLRANVSQSLQKCLDMQAEWPADKNEAYLAVSHGVLAGLFEGQQAQQSGQTLPPDASSPDAASPDAANPDRSLQ
jgi:hypothetical protein